MTITLYVTKSEALELLHALNSASHGSLTLARLYERLSAQLTANRRRA